MIHQVLILGRKKKMKILLLLNERYLEMLFQVLMKRKKLQIKLQLINIQMLL